MRLNILRNAAIAAAVLAPAAAHATQANIDAESCTELRLEKMKFVETGILADLARGPEWAKANLSPEKLRQIELYLQLDEQVKFGCRDAKISPDAARAGQAAVEIEKPEQPAADGKKPADADAKHGEQRITVEPIPQPGAKKKATAGAAAQADGVKPKKQKQKAAQPAASGNDAYVAPYVVAPN